VYINWLIVISVSLGGCFGCFLILKNHPLRYGLIFIFHFIFSISICLCFYWFGFYRYVFPLYYVLPAVVFSFGLLVLFTIHFKTKKFTFPFFFMTINLVFCFEIFLQYIGFIKFRNGWDFWDSYSLYWIYVRLFNFIGDYLIPIKYRNPIKTNVKAYWIFFVLTVVLTIVILLNLLRNVH
jgi:hypothetical protein